MRHLHYVSLVLLIGGVLLTIVGIVVSLPPLWTLSGLLLAIAGGVKVAVVYLWRNVLQIEDPDRRVHEG